MAGAEFLTYDVFTSQVFGGNPLAIFPYGEQIADTQKQRIAREFNLSETVFIEPASQAACVARFRIFTPVKELPFAGHPTIGTALHLARTGALGALHDGQVCQFEEQAGMVAVRFSVTEGMVASATLTAPQAPRFLPIEEASIDLGLATGLSKDERSLAGFEPMFVSCGTDFLLFPVRDLAALARFAMNGEAFDQLVSYAATQGISLNGLFGYTKDGGSWHARMFWKDVGVAEDPATGSAAVCLAGYLAHRESAADGNWQWRLLQGVEMGRPSELQLAATKLQGQVTSTAVGGTAVLISKGEYVCL